MNLWITSNWPAPDNIQAISTTIDFGNLATHAGEQKYTLANRQKLRDSFFLSSEPAWLNQTHSNHVMTIQKRIQSSEQPILEGDASYTQLAEQACVVLTADCLPLLLCDKSGQQVAAIHAGWKGLANGIIAKTIRYFTGKPEEILVWLGPAIGPQAFEVGQDVLDIFISLHPDNKKIIINNNNKYFINIYKLAKNQLNNLGIYNIYGGEYCTYSQSDLFYSYRRDSQLNNVNSGRMASVIWMK